MLGVYDYTVILTYLSTVSASVGIYLSLCNGGHPYIGCVCLMLCGVFDAFDGKVARTKKNRTEFESKFGIMIDSMTDLIAFGVLPACIGGAMIKSCSVQNLFKEIDSNVAFVITIAFFVVMTFYVLAALIRLSYFNITEEERQKTEGGNRKFFEGLPVTTAALLFPSILLLQYLLEKPLTLWYFVAMLPMGFLFISSFKIPKPKTRQLLVLVAIGLTEFILFILKAFVWK